MPPPKRQLHPCGGNWDFAIGGVAPGQRAGAGFRCAVIATPAADPHRQGDLLFRSARCLHAVAAPAPSLTDSRERPSGDLKSHDAGVGIHWLIPRLSEGTGSIRKSALR